MESSHISVAKKADRPDPARAAVPIVIAPSDTEARLIHASVRRHTKPVQPMPVAGNGL